jgi:hypothetical protein
MLKEAIEKIVDLAYPLIYKTTDEHTYACYQDKPVELRPEIDKPQLLKLNSLDALIKLIRAGDMDYELDGITTTRLFMSVSDHNHVVVFTEIKRELRNDRLPLYLATATDVPGWESETRLPFDQAAVALMTRFQENEDQKYALRLLSQITTGAKITYADNGIATTIVTAKGVGLSENTTIRPLVKLRPYRTFQEVEQPEGIFLIRIDERGITFTEADGGMWKLTARKTVKEYLENELKDVDGVTVML